MSHLIPSLKPKELEKIICNKLNFLFCKQKGSHKRYKHDDGRKTTIPFHSGDIDRGLLIKIIKKDLEMSLDEFKELI